MYFYQYKYIIIIITVIITCYRIIYYTFLFFQALGLPQLCGLMALPAEVKVLCCTGYLFSHLLVFLWPLGIKKFVFILVFLLFI